MEAQIANLRRKLDPSIELVFVDGPFECERGPGMLHYVMITSRFYLHFGCRRSRIPQRPILCLRYTIFSSSHGASDRISAGYS
jgi:hypothetical protein